jgi:hypothetical protein
MDARMIHELHHLLELAARRVRKLRLWWTLAWCWALWALAGGIAAITVGRYAIDRRQVVAWLAAGALVSAFVCWRLALRAARDPHRTARRIEARFPELGAILLAAVEQAPAPRFKRLGYLQSTVIRGAVDHGRRHNWADATSLGRLRLAQIMHFAALAMLVAACVALLDRSGAVARSVTGAADEPVLPAGAYEVRVEPGNAEVERGTTLLVIAHFKGAVPTEAALLLEGPTAENPDNADAADAMQTRAMTRSLDDPQFVGRVPSVENDFTYCVEFVGRRTPVYRVTVFDYPELVRADAHLKYPEFTQLDSKTVEDVRHVTAVEGSELTLKFRLNKEVADARLVERRGEEVTLERSKDEAPVYETSFTLVASRRFKLHLADSEGRKNKFPPEIVVNVTPNRPPTLKLTRPARDVRVSPLEELEIAAEVTDDFGVVDYGISYSIGGGEPQDASLASDDSATTVAKSRKLSHLIDFESLKAEPDQLASYHVWAEDLGPDGQPRRVMSDMFFAEVRRFEEIFREGEQPTQQQMQDQAQQDGQGAGQQAEQLAELQKQIVNATWKLIRRETAAVPTPEFGDDVGAVEQSQQQALEQLAELGSRVTDGESRRFVQEIKKHMDGALEQLTRSGQDASAAPLKPALSAEQAAYQALLKLRAREFNVTQANSQQGGGGGGGANGPSQRQLQQLELSAEENRYETRSRATAPDSQAQRRLEESRRLLDKLRELGRRQEDLNERLRELQSALEAAKTEQERREIERQLKRLRDQQREILRDTDQLQGEMDGSENREQIEESRQQLDSARSRVQDASQALDEGRVSDAVNQGARAGRELNELRDQMRRQTADRFSEEMRDLRDAGQELDERQQKLSDQLAQQDAQRGRALRDSGPREELTQGIQQQQDELGQTLEQMRRLVGEAEEPEPLLARELYDAVGETERRQTEAALDVARRLIEAGVTPDAAEAMRQADRGVEELRERLDRAAESVLGDEAEALRRASEQLRDLSDDLNREIENGRGRRGDQPQEEGGTQSDRPRQPGGENQGTQSEPSADRPAGRDQGSGPPEEGTDDDQNRSRDAESDEQRPGQPGPNGQPPGDENQAEGNNGREPQGRQNGQGRGQQENQNNDQAGGQGDSEGQPNATPGPRGGRAGNRNRRLEELFREGGMSGPGGPITGEDFRDWADRMRDVEEMLDDPALSAEVARIRDRAQEARIEFKRHSRPPDWARLQDMVAEPLRELRQRIAEEIRRKESPDALAPIDRDSAPAEFADQIRLYYQRLGSGE